MAPPHHIRLYLEYDAHTGVFRWLAPRGGIRAGSVAGCTQTGRRYERVRFEGLEYQTHRLAWWFVYGDWPSDQIDHINGDPSDNRVSNLRQATASENGCNRAGRRAGPKGVTLHRRLGLYQAQIKKHGRNYYLGVFASEAEAHRAYCAAAKSLHGEFARTA